MNDPIAIEKQAWEDYDRLRELLRRDIRNALERGEILKRLRDTEAYAKLGDGGYDTWNSFINDPEIGISRSYALQNIQAYEFYVLELHLPIEEIERLKTIRMMVLCMTYINQRNLSDEDALELLEKAKTLSYRDFHQEITGEELPVEGEQSVIEGQQTPSLTATSEQTQEQQSYQRIKTERCEMCHKERVEYFEDQICQCDGTFHLVNKSHQEDGIDYQH